LVGKPLAEEHAVAQSEDLRDVRGKCVRNRECVLPEVAEPDSLGEDETLRLIREPQPEEGTSVTARTVPRRQGHRLNILDSVAEEPREVVRNCGRPQAPLDVPLAAREDD